MTMKIDTIKILTCYPEVFAEYGDLFEKISDKPEDEKNDIVRKLQIPTSWKALLPNDAPDAVYTFGLLPTEYWRILLEHRKNIADASRCFEAGRVGIICARMETEEDVEFAKSNFNNAFSAGFYWIDVLYYQIAYKNIADECNAWETIMNCCPFAVAKLLSKRPYYAHCFEPYEFWKFLDKDDWKLLEEKQPSLLLRYKKQQ